MLYVGLAAAPDAEDQQTVDYNQQWTDYMRELATSGALESGAPLQPSGKTVSRDATEDFEPERMDIGGYVIVKAESLEAATEIARRAPHIALGGRTIVRPILSVGG
jgi:hypothetical protein